MAEQLPTPKPGKRTLADWVRGGAYTEVPSEHNRMLYNRERSPWWRWRVAAAVQLILIDLLLLPLWVLWLGLKDMPDWWDAVADSLRVIRTGKLRG